MKLQFVIPPIPTPTKLWMDDYEIDVTHGSASADDVDSIKSMGAHCAIHMQGGSRREGRKHEYLFIKCHLAASYEYRRLYLYTFAGIFREHVNSSV